MLAATLWDPTAPKSAIPDNYFVYDRNIVGPRGRFGPFSFSGTASEAVPPTGYTDLRGRSNFTGAMILGSDGTLDSAVDMVGIQCQTTSSTATRDISNLSDQEQNTVVVSPNLASLATFYKPHAYNNSNSITSSLSANQQWFFTKQRLIGQLSISNDTTQTLYAMQGIINLFGRGGGMPHGAPLTQDAAYPDTYDYGKMRVRIIAQDFAPTLAGAATTLSYSLTNNPAGLVTLSDTAAPADRTYPAGTAHRFLVEVYDADVAGRSPDGAVMPVIPGNGLRGVAVQQGSQQFIQIANPTASALTYTTTMSGLGAIIHTSTLTAHEQYRPAWIASVPGSGVPDFRATIGQTTPTFQNAGTVTFTIPPYGQIVIEQIASSQSVTGTVSLQSWIGAPQPLIFTLTPTGSTTGGILTQTLIPAADGSFALPSVPTGTYTLGIKGDRWLRQDATVNASAGVFALPVITLRAGDVNNDNQVSAQDLGLLRKAYGSTPASANWNPHADLNGDNQVSAQDLGLLRSNYGKIGAQ